MKNVLKQHKMQNYEQLRRPKTNRELMSRPSQNIPAPPTVNSVNSFRLHSQRDSLHVMDGVISND